jgi:UDPglucose 6-dehydrogenase
MSSRRGAEVATSRANVAMKTTVVGSWHLASIYAAGLCTLGHEVRLVCPDDVRRGYERGDPPVYEPGLHAAIEGFVKECKLSFSSDMNDAANAADICFLAEDVKVIESGVDLPSFRELFDAVLASSHFNIVAISATLPLGTCRELQKTGSAVRIIYFPEFLRFGEALARFLHPDHLIVGGDEGAQQRVLDFFSGIDCPKFRVTFEEAEMAKHATNVFMAVTVSFVSELTKFSELYDVNLEKVGEILRTDRRVGPQAYVLPGMGFSGETVERDVRGLLHLGKIQGIRLPLLEQVMEVNDEHNRFIEKRLRRRFNDVRGVKIGFLGATYKPSTSTLRGSLFAVLMEKLAKEGAYIRLYDPYIAQFEFLTSNVEDVFKDADAVVIAVSKREFRALDYRHLVGTMNRRIVIDAANLLEKQVVRDLQLDYASIGRGVV